MLARATNQIDRVANIDGRLRAAKRFRDITAQIVRRSRCELLWEAGSMAPKGKIKAPTQVRRSHPTRQDTKRKDEGISGERVKIDKATRDAIKALLRGVKGKTDVEIMQIGCEIQHRLSAVMAGDGTVEVFKRRKREREAERRNALLDDVLAASRKLIEPE